MPTIAPCPRCGCTSPCAQADGSRKCRECGKEWTPSAADVTPLARELAEQVEGSWSGVIGHVERDAALIDARVRPLVETLRGVRDFLARSQSQDALPWVAKIDAALRAAGAE